MYLPYPVIEQLSDQQVKTWNQHFAGDGHERPRSVEEGTWRRTQEPANAEQSGWREDGAGRRRVVHYRYDYGLDYTFPVPRLVLSELYLYVSFTAPAEEISAYGKHLQGWLAEGRWKEKANGWHRSDLVVTLTEHDVHPQDERADRETPAGSAPWTSCSPRRATAARPGPCGTSRGTSSPAGCASRTSAETPRTPKTCPA
ncbi:hypothetical protein ACFV7R_43420 [Streptomyces sp. NPDC059866]|uniref:hypothetical protein n=1 Tax=Streptomyces sp. NPDC059866 TaxID=3346978 RepID=UPI00364765EE